MGNRFSPPADNHHRTRRDGDGRSRLRGGDRRQHQQQLYVGGPVCVAHKTPEAIKILLWHRSNQLPRARRCPAWYIPANLTPRNSIQLLQYYYIVWSVQQQATYVQAIRIK